MNFCLIWNLQNRSEYPLARCQSIFGVLEYSSRGIILAIFFIFTIFWEKWIFASGLDHQTGFLNRKKHLALAQWTYLQTQKVLGRMHDHKSKYSLQKFDGPTFLENGKTVYSSLPSPMSAVKNRKERRGWWFWLFQKNLEGLGYI